MLERLLQLRELGRARHEARRPVHGGHASNRAHRRGADQLEDLDRRIEALDGPWPERFDCDRLTSQAQRAARDECASGLGHLLHPGGEMSRLAYGRVVHAQIVADRAHDHFSRVEADADMQRDALRAPELFGVASELLLHAQRGEAGADGVVLAGERCAEQRHDAVAHDLVDGAVVAVHRLHHPLDDGIEQLARLFRIAVREQLHRALDVGEQNGDLLALAFDAGAGGEYPLSQVLRRISLRGRHGCSRFQPRPARVTEAGPGRVFLLAAAAVHDASLPLYDRRTTNVNSGLGAALREAPSTLDAPTPYDKGGKFLQPVLPRLRRGLVGSGRSFDSAADAADAQHERGTWRSGDDF